MATVFKYRSCFGNGGEQTGGLTHADTDCIAIDSTVRLDVDSRVARLDHHDGINKRVLPVETAPTVVLQHHFNDVRSAGSKVSPLEVIQNVPVVSGMTQPEFIVDIPCVVDAVFVGRRYIRHRRESFPPADGIGQMQSIFGKINRTVIVDIQKDFIRTERTAVGIHESGLNLDLMLMRHHGQPEDSAGIARAPKYMHAGIYISHDMRRIITANGHLRLNQMRIGGTFAADHIHIDYRIAVMVGMNGQSIFPVYIGGDKVAVRTRSAITPSIGCSTLSRYAQGIAQTDAGIGIDIERACHGGSPMDIQYRTLCRLGDRTHIVGENSHIHAVAFVPRAAVGLASIRSGDMVAVVVPLVARVIGVTAVEHRRKRTLRTAEERIGGLNPQIGFDGRIHLGVSGKYYGIKYRTQGIVERVNHRLNRIAVKKSAQIFADQTVLLNQYIVHIPVDVSGNGINALSAYRSGKVITTASARQIQNGFGYRQRVVVESYRIADTVAAFGIYHTADSKLLALFGRSIYVIERRMVESIVFFIIHTGSETPRPRTRTQMHREIVSFPSEGEGRIEIQRINRMDKYR